MPYKRGSVRFSGYDPLSERVRVGYPVNSPGYDVWRPGSRPPDSFDEFISVVGDSLAALWWVQRAIYEGRNSSDDECSAYIALRVSSFHATQLLPRYDQQLRNVHKPTVPEFDSRAVLSYNEHACQICDDRAAYLFQWVTGREQAAVEDVPLPQRWRELGPFVAAQIGEIRERWPFEPNWQLALNWRHPGYGRQSQKDHSGQTGFVGSKSNTTGCVTRHLA